MGAEQDHTGPPSRAQPNPGVVVSGKLHQSAGQVSRSKGDAATDHTQDQANENPSRHRPPVDNKWGLSLKPKHPSRQSHHGQPNAQCNPQGTRGFRRISKGQVSRPRPSPPEALNFARKPSTKHPNAHEGSKHQPDQWGVQCVRRVQWGAFQHVAKVAHVREFTVLEPPQPTVSSCGQTSYFRMATA